MSTFVNESHHWADSLNGNVICSYVVSAMTCTIYRDLASIPIAVDVIKCTVSEKILIWRNWILEEMMNFVKREFILGVCLSHHWVHSLNGNVIRCICNDL